MVWCFVDEAKRNAITGGSSMSYESSLAVVSEAEAYGTPVHHGTLHALRQEHDQILAWLDEAATIMAGTECGDAYRNAAKQIREGGHRRRKSADR